MRNWSLIGIAIFILAGLIYLVYMPLVVPAPVAGSRVRDTVDVPPGPTVLTFGSDPWPPYAGTAGSDREGYIVDILHEVFDPLGYEVRYVNRPWSRCIEQVREGELTGLAGCDMYEAQDLLYPRHAIGVTEPAFFVLEESDWRYTGVGSLLEVRLGAIKSYTYQRDVDVYIRRHENTARVSLVGGNDALAQLIDKLRAGRIEAFIENAPVVRRVLGASMETDGIKAAGRLEGLELFVGFSPDIPDAEIYPRIFDRRIVELRSSGRLAEILAKYDMEDWAPSGPTRRGTP